MQSRITSETNASAVTSGPLGIDTDPGNNPSTPNFNGSTNARDAAGVVSLSSLASVALAPYNTGVNESPVALPPQTDFTPIPATFPASISLPPTDPNTGLVINGPNNQGRLGQSIAGIGDFNGDGIDDLAVAEPETNRAYVLYGKSSGFGTGVNFNNLAASDGVSIQNININGSFQGTSPTIAPAGDLNNDGLADLAIIGNISNATGYVIYGRPTSSSGPIDGNNLGSPDGFRITGIPNKQNSGPELNITGVGDVSGDGIDDLFIANSNTNQSFLIFGTTSQASQVNISSGLGSSGVNIINSVSGINTSTRLGQAATGLGDINGDGIDDFAVSAPGLQGFGGTPGDGRVYVIYGGVILNSRNNSYNFINISLY